MKNLLFLIIILSIFASCKKQYTCNCSGISGSDPKSFDYKYVKQKDAKTACDKQTSLYKPIYPSANCSLTVR